MTDDEPGLRRFGPFEFAPETGELRRDGQPVALQPQPARVLARLIRAPGRLVSLPLVAWLALVPALCPATGAEAAVHHEAAVGALRTLARLALTPFSPVAGG